jgi:hypothetical protein
MNLNFIFLIHVHGSSTGVVSKEALITLGQIGLALSCLDWHIIGSSAIIVITIDISFQLR